MVWVEGVPLVAAEVFENGDGAVRFVAGGLQESDVASLPPAIVVPEIVGMEKEEDAATGLPMHWI